MVVASRTFDQHLQDLQEVLGLLDRASMRLNVEKCEFAKHQIRLLGSVIGEGVFLNPNKVKTIVAIKRPHLARDVQCFLGACGFYLKP